MWPAQWAGNMCLMCLVWQQTICKWYWKHLSTNTLPYCRLHVFHDHNATQFLPAIQAFLNKPSSPITAHLFDTLISTSVSWVAFQISLKPMQTVLWMSSKLLHLFQPIIAHRPGCIAALRGISPHLRTLYRYLWAKDFALLVSVFWSSFLRCIWTPPTCLHM